MRKIIFAAAVALLTLFTISGCKLGDEAKLKALVAVASTQCPYAITEGIMANSIALVQEEDKDIIDLNLTMDRKYNIGLSALSGMSKVLGNGENGLFTKLEGAIIDAVVKNEKGREILKLCKDTETDIRVTANGKVFIIDHNHLGKI